MEETVQTIEGSPSGKDVAPRLLVIDDERGIRDLLAFEFEGRGWRVVAASSGEEGVEAARVRRPDVVLCDLSLPVKDGAAVLAALKDADPSLEVLMVTGRASLESAVACLRHGAYDYVTKPFDLDDLARRVDRALEKRRMNKNLDLLREQNRLKTGFLADMSHELRTPMNAVIGYTSLLLDGSYGPLTEKQRQALTRVDVNGRQLLQLINNLLDVSKARVGRMDLYVETFTVAELLREVTEGLEPLALRNALKLAFEAPAGLLLKTDRMKLKQVLVNLVGNGLKFTRAGGVTIRAEVVLSDGAAHGGRVRLRVSDTGGGIRAEDIPKLFQEFRQPDAAAAREFGGTGLGLAITRRLITLLGGSVSVESALGEGSTFTVTLPVAPPREQVQGEEMKEVSDESNRER